MISSRPQGFRMSESTPSPCLFFSFVVPTSSRAYRPFISNDAAVADPKEIEIELW